VRHPDHRRYQKRVEEVVVCYMETEATCRPGDASNLRPNHFEVPVVLLAQFLRPRIKICFKNDLVPAVIPLSEARESHKETIMQLSSLSVHNSTILKLPECCRKDLPIILKHVSFIQEF
jgi:hypothetical protein